MGWEDRLNGRAGPVSLLVYPVRRLGGSGRKSYGASFATLTSHLHHHLTSPPPHSPLHPAHSSQCLPRLSPLAASSSTLSSRTSRPPSLRSSLASPSTRVSLSPVPSAAPSPTVVLPPLMCKIILQYHSRTRFTGRSLLMRAIQCQDPHPARPPDLQPRLHRWLQAGHPERGRWRSPHWCRPYLRWILPPGCPEVRWLRVLQAAVHWPPRLRDRCQQPHRCLPRLRRLRRVLR
jgi:hypothetical protein